MTITSSSCAECGREIRSESADGLCAVCLFGLALADPLEAPAHREPGTAPGALHLPARFANYELIERVGQGGMGVVFKARQLPINRTVAVKLLLSGSLATEGEVRRFRKEAEAAATLKHPNIVAIHEVGEHEGRPFFSMDFIDGQSLSKILKRTPLPVPRATRYARIIAQAVHYAHTRGILHRDLKPANVLVDAADQPHITDFGLARQIEVESDLTISGAVLGTPSYMPPEQAAGKRREIGPAADIYALGATLYDLLTGRPPFRADTPVDTLRQVLDSEAVPPRLLNPKVPRDLETICLKCLAKEPSERYASARAFAEDLERFERHEPIAARPIGSLARTWRWCRRNASIAIPLATVALLLVSISIAALLFAREMDKRLQRLALQGNLYAARGVANTVLLQFRDWSREVASVAARPDLARAFVERDSAALQRIMEQVHREHTRSLGPTNAFQSWYVEDPEGFLLAVHPFNPEIIGKNFAGRDYFQGAMRQRGARGMTSVHLSKVFKAQNDGFYKFALSAPVYASDDSGAPILGIVAATVAASSTLGTVPLHDARSRAVLLGRWDTNAITDGQTTKHRYLILFHPAYGETGSEQIEVVNPRLDQIHSPRSGDEFRLHHPSAELTLEHCVDPNYADPRLPGRWLSAFAPVGETECVVIVQTPRDELSQFNRDLFHYLAISGGAAVGFATLAAGLAALHAFVRAREPS